MPRRPQLMVLYTNDALEVRYTDGSQLHILPCGTSFTFHSPQDGAHPANGMEMVQQRCRFVTSTYRNMLLAALDFRNRFSERPYLCEELQESDQVVPLYARIEEIAWPKQASSNTELLDDGSVCVTSEDQYGSLILSAHRRDFTLCYLSLLSQEKARHRSSANVRPIVQNNAINSNNSEKKLEKSEDTKSLKKPCIPSVSSNMPDVVPVNRDYSSIEKSPERLTNIDTPGCNDLNISPITQASCYDSPQALSNTSGSPLTPKNAVKDNEAKFRPFSTPTEGLEDNETPVCTPYGKTAVFNDYLKVKSHSTIKFAQSENLDGSFIGENFPQRDKLSTKEDSGLSSSDRESRRVVSERCRGDNPAGDHCQDTSSSAQLLTSKDTKRSENSQTLMTNITWPSQGSGDSTRSTDGDCETRYTYTWLTRHISCEEIPANLAPVVKLAREVAEQGKTKLIQGSDITQQIERKPSDVSKFRHIDKKKCFMSRVTLPLPLSCPGQHLHKMQIKRAYDDGKDPLEDPTTFCQGRLKVLLVDGIIYRIVRHPTMKLVEIYPGDGSVLLSQGMSAHFFVHVIPHGDTMEERTYSIKSPPPTVKGKYSVKSMLNRAHRFLTYVRQEENAIPASVGLCCWKHEEPIITEPEATAILEECEIQGYGKFSALSNGQIRIVFKDRTCLDMTCDFSSRLQRYADIETSIVNIKPNGRLLADKTAGTCRLLLPNGQYQIMDIQHPGVYKRYIDIAQEWAAWVNSSPAQRQLFYKHQQDTNINMSVERELQKIQCFNYIVDNTLTKKLPPSDSGSNLPGAFKPYKSTQQKPGPSILRNSDLIRDKNNIRYCDVPQRTVQINPPTSRACVHTDLRSSVIGGDRNISKLGVPRQTVSGVSGRSSLPVWSDTQTSSLQGFNSVREALLRTSSVIKDIDQLLEKK